MYLSITVHAVLLIFLVNFLVSFFLGKTVGELPKGSSNHYQVAKKKGKMHVDAPAEVKRRTNPKIKTRDATDMAGSSSPSPLAKKASKVAGRKAASP
jgi:hypothetical protein